MDREDGLEIRSHVKYSEPKDGTSNFSRELQTVFRRHANRVLLVSGENGREWTGACLLDHCGRLATALIREVGLKPDDVVMTICDHSDEEIAMAMGVVMAGAAIYGTSPTDGYAEVETLCNIVKPNVFVVSGHYHSRAAQLCSNVEGLQSTKIIWLNKPGEGGTYRLHENASNGFRGGHLSALAHGPHCQQVLLVERLIERQPDWELLESVAYEQIDAKKHNLTYMLTSGSTGRPKVVPSTHEELIHGLSSMISACRNEMIISSGHKAPSNGATNGHLLDENNNICHPKEEHKTPLMPCGPDEIVSGDLPLDHGAGFNTTVLSFWLGSKFVVIPSFDVDSFWQAVSDHKISYSLSSTTFTYRLFTRLKELIDAGETNKWDLSSFKYIACCGSKLVFLDLVREVQRHYSHINVVQAYGCTEIGFISMLHVDDCRTHLESTGYLFPGLIAKIVDRDNPNRLCGPNEQGELLVWSRSKFKGYRSHKAEDPIQIYADCHDDRGLFYRTGDQAHVDERGRFYIHGRFKDTLFLMEDWKILPAELEGVINEHPAVEMSAVVGMPDPNLPGCHAPKAFVKLLTFSEAELRKLSSVDKELSACLEANDLEALCKHIYDFVAIRTTRPKHLTGGVRILTEFPRVGLLNKIDRKQLKLMD